MGNELNQTVYGGVKVDQATKDALVGLHGQPGQPEQPGQPAADFLNFVDLGNGEFSMKMKFPEMGLSGRGTKDEPFKEVHIRRNMNYLMKAMAKGIMTDGKVDLSKVEPWISQTMVNIGLYPECVESIIDMAGIPKKDRDEFRTFAANEQVMLMQYIRGFEGELLNISQYYRAAEDVTRVKDPAERAAQERVLLDSYEEAERIIGGIVKAANLNPEKEKEVFITPDCGSFATANNKIMGMVNAYRESQRQEKIEGGLQRLEFQAYRSAGAKEVAQGTPENAFEFHIAFTLSAKVADQKKVISIEATAPPMGKLFFHPERGRTGTGIYDSKEEIKEFYESKNTVVVPDRKAYSALKTHAAYEIVAGKPQLVQMPKHMQELYRVKMAKAQTSGTTLEALIAKGNSSDIDRRMISSSKQFKDMKQALAGLKGLQGTERVAALAAARKAALEYTRYKLNEGASSKPSDYERARVSFGHEVLGHVSAELNQLAAGDIERNPVTLDSGEKVFLADGGGGLIPAVTVKEAYMNSLMGMLTEVNGLGEMSEWAAQLNRELGQTAAKLASIEASDLNLDKIKELTEGLEKAATAFTESIEPGKLTPEQKKLVGIFIQTKQLNQMATNGVKQPDQQYKELLAGKLLGNIMSGSLAENKPHMVSYCRKIMTEPDAFEAVMAKTKADKVLTRMVGKATPEQIEKMLEMTDEQFMGGYSRLQQKEKPVTPILDVPAPEVQQSIVSH